MTTSVPNIQQTTHEILIVIDTVTIKNKYYDVDIKKSIRIDDANWFVICQKSSHLNTGQAVFINSKINDKIVISGISIDGGSSDAIILNQIQNYKQIKKSIVLFEPICLSRKKISNNKNSEQELSVINSEQNFIWFESLISDFGRSKIKIYFSLYYLNSDGNQQDLYGHFWFPLEINFYE